MAISFLSGFCISFGSVEALDIPTLFEGAKPRNAGVDPAAGGRRGEGSYGSPCKLYNTMCESSVGEFLAGGRHLASAWAAAMAMLILAMVSSRSDTTAHTPI